MTRKGARIERVRPAGPDHQVVSVEGEPGYRRRPCAPCPWVVTNAGEFPPEAFCHSAETAEDGSMKAFGCHESGIDGQQTCAGFLLRGAVHNFAVRIKCARGLIDLDQVHEDGRELHPGYITMAVANGVPPDHDALRNCRPSPWEE